MPVSHRIVSVILLLVLIIFSLLTLLYFVGLVPLDLFVNTWRSLYKNLWAMGVALIVFILSIWTLAPYFIKANPLQTTVYTGELGQVSVALDAVENFVQRIVSEQNGIRDVKTEVEPDGDTLKILLRISVSAEVAIPSLNVHLQEKIKMYVAKATGVTVSKVEILVEKIEVAAVKNVD